MKKLSSLSLRGLLFFGFMAFFLACEKQYDGIENTAKKADGMLSFSTFDEFQQMVSKIGKMTPNELQTYENAQTGFVSMRKLFDQAMLEEEQNYDKEAAQNSKVHQTSATLLKYPTLALKLADAGYETNITDTRYTYLVNGNGLVRIGDYVYQYSKEYIKEIKDSPNKGDIVSIFNSNDDTNASLGLVVGHNKLIGTTPNARMDGTTIQVRSCDIYDDGGSPKVYRLLMYEESILEEQPYGATTYINVTYTINGQTTSIPKAVQAGRIYRSIHKLTLKTYKRGFWGSWIDHSTSMQSVSGQFKIFGNVSSATSQYGTLPGPISYFNLNPGYTTSVFSPTIFAESQWFPTPYEAQNVKFDYSSKHYGTWTKDGRTCNCNI